MRKETDETNQNDDGLVSRSTFVGRSDFLKHRTKKQ